MNCADCGESLLSNAQYCHVCGARREAPRIRRKRKRQQHRVDPSERSPRGSRVGTVGTDSWDDEEKLLWIGTFSAKGMINHWLVAIAASLLLPILAVSMNADQTLWLALMVAVGAIWAFMFGILIYRKLDVHYELTNQRLIHEFGILNRETNRIEVIDVDDVAFRQSILERFVGSGTIEIMSSDQSDPIIELFGIDDVYHLAELIDSARRKERIRRGIHIEAV